MKWIEIEAIDIDIDDTVSNEPTGENAQKVADVDFGFDKVLITFWPDCNTEAYDPWIIFYKKPI